MALYPDELTDFISWQRNDVKEKNLIRLLCEKQSKFLLGDNI